MVSFIVPTYKDEAYLPACLASIAGQTAVTEYGEEIEIIVVRDELRIENGELRIENGELRMENGELGIENGELGIENGELRIENWGEAEVENCGELRITYLSQEHAGQSAARNRGLKAAKGEYIVFVDADDRLEPDWLKAHLDAMTDEVDYVQSGYKRIENGELGIENGELRIENCGEMGIENGEMGIENLELRKLLSNNRSSESEIRNNRSSESEIRIENWELPRNKYRFTSPCMRLYRRKAIEGMRFEEGMIYEDILWSVDLWLRRLSCRKINNTGYLYTLNPQSTTSRRHPEAEEKLFKALRERAKKADLRGKMIICYTMMRARMHFLKERGLEE